MIFSVTVVVVVSVMTVSLSGVEMVVTCVSTVSVGVEVRVEPFARDWVVVFQTVV